MNTRHLAVRRRGESGAIVFLAAISLLLILAFGALVVDGGHIYAVNTQCQATADGAALAAAYQLPDLILAEEAALEYGVKNMPTSQHGNVIEPNDIEFGTWDFTNRIFTPTNNALDVNAVRVTTQRSTANGNALPLTLGNALGFSTTDISRSAVAAFGTLGIWDISLAQDVTGSFTDEIDESKEADQALLDCLLSGVDPRSTFGLVSFTGWGQVKAGMTEIGTGYNSLTSSISSLASCGQFGAPECSGTDIAVGLEFAVQNLNNAAAQTPNAPRAIVLVTDGQPNADGVGQNDPMNDAQLKALATQWANTADSQDISVFVVFFDQGLDRQASAFLASLVRGSGVFLSTPDPEELPELLSSICGNIGPLRLVD